MVGAGSGGVGRVGCIGTVDEEGAVGPVEVVGISGGGDLTVSPCFLGVLVVVEVEAGSFDCCHTSLVGCG